MIAGLALLTVNARELEAAEWRAAELAFALTVQLAATKEHAR
jgi:hypothetical protein